MAVVLRSSTAQAILEHVRLPSRPLPLAPATSPPQLGLCRGHGEDPTRTIRVLRAKGERVLAWEGSPSTAPRSRFCRLRPAAEIEAFGHLRPTPELSKRLRRTPASRRIAVAELVRQVLEAGLP